MKYEIEMMLESASDIGCGWASPPTTMSDWRMNMALECFLLHYRNLRAFLCPILQPPPKDDDILASDFLGKPTAEHVGDKTRIEDDKRRLDQMLAHLSYNRLTEFKAQGNIYWYTAKMVVAMILQLDVFLVAVPDHMKPWFPDRAKLAEHRVRMEGWVNQRTARAHTMADPVVYVSTSLPK